MRTAASSDQPDSHPRDRASHDRAPHDRAPRDHHRGGSRNNPEWMSDGGAAGAEDAAGLTAGARRAKDFESERQRMKEEWKKEQAQLKGTTYQPVCLKFVDSQVPVYLTAFDSYCATSWVKLVICHHGTCRTWHLRKSSSSTAPQGHLCLLLSTVAYAAQVSMAEFMSDEDLEALKADTNVEMPASAQSANGQVQHPIELHALGPCTNSTKLFQILAVILHWDAHCK